jgi:hypothetical protein
MRNLASIEDGRHLVWDGTNHQLKFTAAETKNDRAYAAAMPQNLTTYVHQWLDACRPILQSTALPQLRWGPPLAQALGPAQGQRRHPRLDRAPHQASSAMPVWRHLFRDCAVTELLDCAPEDIRHRA